MSSSVLNTIGLVVGFFGAAVLVRFGIAFQGNEMGFYSLGKVWRKLHLTLECGQRLGFILLAMGFVVQFIAQLLRLTIGWR